MIVLIASTRTPKINGVKRAFRRLTGEKEFPAILFESISVESGVKDTPLSVDELMTGARQRAELATSAWNRKGATTADSLFAVGVEGGISIMGERAFLQSWACVLRNGSSSFGSSGSIELPHAVAEAVVTEGKDLGEIIDRFAGQLDVRSNQGTWGILTKDLVTREDSFELATLNALAPYFNSELYSRGLPPAP
ncbi:MAG TPA: inosine/xanthosine triphosphatase [Bacteroidota bacterium]|nr:inosine/xanthosine triphosphatase [Bacteroidota bacterium]